MIKYAFFDIDNTIYSLKDKKIRESVIHLFEKLNKNNVKIGIATGRPDSNIECITPLTEYISYYVLSNGVYVRDKNSIVYENKFTKDDLDFILSLARKYNITVGAGTKEKYGIIFKGSETGLREYEKIIKYDDIKDDIHSIWIKSLNKKYLKKIYKKVNKNKNLTAFFWNYGGLDITKKHHSKAYGVKKIIDKGDFLISVGDGENDLELFKLANVKIGMKTSKCKKLIKISDYLAKSAASDDLYNIFLNDLKIIS